MKHKSILITLSLLMLLNVGCGDLASVGDDSTESSVDITDVILTSTSNDCETYVNVYSAVATDLSNNNSFISSFEVANGTSACTLTSNSIPNHEFHNAAGTFASDIVEVDAEVSIIKNPVFGSSNTELSLSYDNAIFLNGVKLDLLAAGCYGVGNGNIGCGDNQTDAWRYDPMSPLVNFGTDAHNAHTQPTGAYHYHGNPEALFDQGCSVESPVIGFAADGFPIMGTCINDGGSIREVVSGYILRTGLRVEKNGESASGLFPGGSYDGSFRDDYQYDNGSTGDLDECNGRTDSSGNYAYHVTNAYPWVLGCYKGTPDESFNKMSGGGPGGPGL